MKYLLLIFIVLFASVSHAGDKTFNWTMPTEREDGTALSPDELAATNIYCNEALTAAVTPGATSYIHTFPPGIYECYATVVDMGGLESKPSNVTLFTIPKSLPKSPADFSVN